MAGGSIDALIDGRNPTGNQFNLRVVDGAEFMLEITHRLRRQILRHHQIEKAFHLRRHQAHRLIDMRHRRPTGVKVFEFGALGMIRAERRHPGDVRFRRRADLKLSP